MVSGKKAQFFGVYIFLFTILLCGMVIYFHFVQQENAYNSLVSPRSVLEVRDGLEIFELREKEIILESLKEVSKENSIKYCKGDFDKEFRKEFLSRVNSDERMKEFIMKDLTLEGRSIEVEARVLSMNFFENILYPEEGMKCDKKNNLLINRGRLGKEFRMFGNDKTKIHFPVKFSFEFDKGYVVVYNDKGYKIFDADKFRGLL